MKVKRGVLFLLAIVIFMFFVNVESVNAVNTGFQTKRLSNEEKNNFISNINILTIDEEPEKKSIACIDVNSNHLIAIGQESILRKTICIYSNEGVFQYGYTFNSSGDYGVEWDGENLNIYFIRSDRIVTVTPTGEVLEVLEVQNTIENNSYVNNFINSSKKNVDGTEYSIRNNLGILNWLALSYSQVIVKDGTGTENVIYDVSSMQLFKIITIITIVCVLVLLFIVLFARQMIQFELRKNCRHSLQRKQET